MRRHDGSNFQQTVYQCNHGNGRFTTLQSLCDNTWSRTVGSMELWNIKVVKPTGSYWGDDDACVVWGHSPVDIVNDLDLSAAQFVTINVDGSVTSNDICVVKSPTAVDAQHVRWSSEWTIDHNSFRSVSSYIYTVNCSHLQPICMCFNFKLFFIHRILIAVNDINWAPSLKELSERL